MIMCHDRIVTTKSSVNENNVDNTAICDVEHHKKIPHIVETVRVEEIIKPVYNFKAGGE